MLAERPAALGPGVSGEYAKIGSITAIDLALFVSLLVGQIVTTNLALHRGTGWGANVVMALAQANLGTSRWVPTFVLVTLVVTKSC